MELKTIKEFAHKNNLGEGLKFESGLFQLNLDGEFNTIASSLNQLNTKVNLINEQLGTVYKVKGSTTVDNINSMTVGNAMIGYVYNLLDSGVITNGIEGELEIVKGGNIVYTEEGWDEFAVSLDLDQCAGDNISIEGNVISALGYKYDKEKESFSVGVNTTASEHFSYAEGYYTTASGEDSHSEGSYTTASGKGSHVEGNYIAAIGEYSHAEGTTNHWDCVDYSWETNTNTITLAAADPAIPYFKITHEGNVIILKVISSNEEFTVYNVDKEIPYDYQNSRLEAFYGVAEGDSSHREGHSTVASGHFSHAEGTGSKSKGTSSHAEGEYTEAIGYGSHAEGHNTKAEGDYSHAEGYNTTASEYLSHAEGNSTTSSGRASHSEGSDTVASGQASHAEGNGTTASGEKSHAEGYKSNASGNYSHAENGYTHSAGDYTHAEGRNVIAKGECSHAEGYGSIIMPTITVYKYGNSEYYTDFQMLLFYSPIELLGSNNRLDVVDILSIDIDGKLYYKFKVSYYGEYKTITPGDYTIYYNTGSYGKNSHVEGLGNITHNEGEHALGVYNISHKASDTFGDKGNTIHSIGIGDLDGDKNAQEIMQNGDHYIIGIGDYNGTNPYEAKTLQLVITDLESVEPVTYIAGTNIDITDNVISAQGYVYDEEKNSFSTGSGSATGDYSYAEGYDTNASGYCSHVEGYDTTASMNYSHAEGNYTIASGPSSHAEGGSTKATGGCSHAEGSGTVALGYCSHAEGSNNSSGLYGYEWELYSQSITFDSVRPEIKIGSILRISADGKYQFVKVTDISEDKLTVTVDEQISLESNNSRLYIVRGIAYGDNSHSEGDSTVASGNNSHAEGLSTEAKNDSEHAQGKYNKSNTGETEDAKTIHSIGIGTDDNNRMNAFEVMRNGDFYVINVGSYDGTNIESAKTLQEVINELSSKESPNEVYVGTTVEGEPTIFIDTDEENDIEVYTKGQVDSLISDVRKDIDIILGPDAGVISVNGQTGIVELDILTKEELTTEVNTLNTRIDNISSEINAYTAGTNIDITDNVISSLGYKYNKEKDSFSIGLGTATGEGSHAEGNKTTASGAYSHAEGVLTKAEGHASHAEGTSTKASRTAHAEGGSTEATGNYSHSEGYQTKASGECSHAEGSLSVASSSYSHVEGFFTISNNEYEHSQGQFNVSNKNSTTFGDARNTIHSIGIGTSTNDRKNAQEVMQNGDHYIIGVGGYNGVTIEGASSVLNVINTLIDTDIPAINQRINELNIPTLPENIVNTINGQTGDVTIDTSEFATKEEVQAVNTRIDGLNIPSDLSNVVTKTDDYQVTLGTDNNPTHEKTLLVGTGLTTSNNESLVVGAYNNSEHFTSWGVDAPAIQVGAGTENSKRTVMVVQKNGKSLGLLGFEQNGLGDFAEYFEWADGNPEGEDRVGYMVLLNEDKIELAESLDNCIGIITGTGSFVADAACLDWHGRYLKDKWGRNIYALTGVLAENPEYDPTKEYIPREYRKEWSPVGLVGKILVRQDGTLKPNGFVGCKNGIATDVDKSSWRVLKVIDEEIALILIK